MNNRHLFLQIVEAKLKSGKIKGEKNTEEHQQAIKYIKWRSGVRGFGFNTRNNLFFFTLEKKKKHSPVTTEFLVFTCIAPGIDNKASGHSNHRSAPTKHFLCP